MKKEVKDPNAMLMKEPKAKEEVKTEEPKLDLATCCCCHSAIEQPSLEKELEKKR